MTDLKLNLTSELLTLLDLIELQTEDSHIKELTRQRFDIAERAGYTVEFCEHVSGKMN